MHLFQRSFSINNNCLSKVFFKCSRTETLNLIGVALNEGSLDIESMTVKAWYKYLLEVNVTHSGEPGSRELVLCQVERLNPLMDWKKSWRAASLPGLT